MWGTHFSPIFNASLEDPLTHDLEHVATSTAGLLFWWPVVGIDPRRGGWATRPGSGTSSSRCHRTRSWR